MTQELLKQPSALAAAWGKHGADFEQYAVPDLDSLESFGGTANEDTGFLDTLEDGIKSLGAGLYDGVAETVNLVPDVVNSLSDDASEPMQQWMETSGYESKTMLGGGIKALTQFAVGFVGLGKFGTLIKGGSKLAKIGRGMTRGAIADFSAFDAYEDRLSNLVQSVPMLSNPLAEYLAADEKDEAMEGRFKNALEGLGLGIMMEAFITSFARSVKTLRAAKDPKQARQYLEEVEKELSDKADAAVREVEENTPAPKGDIEAAVTADPDQLPDAFNAVDLGEVAPGAAKSPTQVTLELSGEGAERAGGILRDLADNKLDATVQRALEFPLKTGRISSEQAYKFVEDALREGRTAEEVNEYMIGNSARVSFRSKEEMFLFTDHVEKAFELTLKGQGVETHQKILRDCGEFINIHGLQELQRKARVDRTAMAGLAARWQAYKIAARAEIDNILSLRGQMKMYGRSPALDKELRESVERFNDFSLTSKDITSTAGRITSAGRITPRHVDPELFGQLVEQVDGNVAKLLRMQYMLSLTKWQRGFKLFQETVINGLLSAPASHAANTLGNVFKMGMMAPEKILGASLRGDINTTREGLYALTSLKSVIGESLRYGLMSIKVADNILDAGHKVLDMTDTRMLTTLTQIREDMLLRKQAAAKDFNVTLNPLEKLLSGFFAAFGVPSRLLGGADEVFKQINYRAEVKGRLASEAFLKFNGDPVAMGEYVADGMKKTFEWVDDGKGGKIAWGGLDEGGLRAARVGTQTQGLDYGLGLGLQRMAQSNPCLRFVLPFIRTPTNLFRDFVAHTPFLCMTTKRWKEAMKAQGAEAARAEGQAATGLMLWSGAAMLAYNGVITGGYPKDPATAQAWKDAGILPYSLKIGDTYISYARLDPFATFLGIAADVAEYGRNWGDSAKGEVAAMMAMALVSNITQKSYLTGITELMAALSDDSAEAVDITALLRRTAGMAVPLSGLLRWGRQNTDPAMREVRGFVDSLMNSVPVASRYLAPKVSWLSGKPVSNNVFFSNGKPDPVLDELSRLGPAAPGGAPPRELKMVELNGAQYSRLCELQGTIRIGGLTLHERLERAMSSASYDLERRRYPDMPGDEENPRSKIIKDIINQYRAAAQKRLLQEDEALAAAASQEFNLRRAARRGDRDKYQELLTMPKQ
jgi:hypothetical protein